MPYRSKVLRTVTALALAASFGCDRAPRDPAATGTQASIDPRKEVVLPADGQQAVLHEMRQMLGAVGGAMAAVAQQDTVALLAALAPAGSAAAADPAIEALLPPAWKELAEQTHGGFDSLAAAVRRSPGGRALQDTVMVRLAQLVGTCTACHETFRVTVE